MNISRSTIPDPSERKLAVAMLLGQRLRELGHDTDPGRIIDLFGGGRSDWYYCPVDGRDVFSLDEERQQWSVESNGKLRLIVERRYNTNRQFPEPKKGFDIDKLAKAISEEATARKTYEERAEQEEKGRDHSRATMGEVIDELGLKAADEDDILFRRHRFQCGNLTMRPRCNGVNVELDVTISDKAKLVEAVRLLKDAGLLDYDESEPSS